ncbi:hypothetical protein D1872_305570 [compost metagenome]
MQYRKQAVKTETAPGRRIDQTGRLSRLNRLFRPLRHVHAITSFQRFDPAIHLGQPFLQRILAACQRLDQRRLLPDRRF